MADYVKAFDPRILGLTGTPEQIAAAAKQYHVYYAVEDGGAGDAYVVDHSSYIYVMDPSGRFAKLLAGDLPADRMAQQIEKLMGAQS
jgi:protein SCO1/2